MSTLYKPKGKTHWYLSWYEGGKQRCVSLRTQDKKAARHLQDEKDREIKQEKAREVLGITTPRQHAENMTLQAFLELYRARVMTHQLLSRSTLEKLHVPYIKQVILFAPEATLKDLTEAFVTHYETTVRGQYSDYGWNTRRSTLRSIFKRAVAWHLLSANPFDHLTRATPKKKRPKRLYQEQVPLVLKHTYGPFWQLVVLFLYATGVRLGELCNLKRTDVRRQQGYIEIETNKENEPKVIAITSTIGKIVDMAESLSRSQYVFSLDGGKLKDETVKSFFDRISKRCGFRVSAHRFRHAHGTHVKEAGGNLRDIQETLGHADIRTTAGYYLDADLEAQRRSMSLLPIENLLTTVVES